MTLSKNVRPLIVAASVLCLLGATPAPAAGQSDTEIPDLSGLWTGGRIGNLEQALGRELPFTPYGRERYENVDHALNPAGFCLPIGPARIIQAPLPYRFVQTPDVVTILFEYQRTFRLIYTDGRDHPEDIADYPEWMGHSIGHYEGNALVVETVGINERSWLDTAGHEHSDQLRLLERFEKTGPESIEWTVTFEDPVFFTEPFTVSRTFSPEPTRILDYSCLENEKDAQHLLTGVSVGGR